MKKLILSSLLVFIFPVLTFAETYIPPGCRVHNMGYGVCMWAAIETSARVIGQTKLKGLTAKRNYQSHEKVDVVKPIWNPASGGYVQTTVKEERKDNGGTNSRALEEFNLAGLSSDEYTMSETGDYNYAMLKKVCNPGGQGAVVHIKDYEHTPTKKLEDGCFRYQIPGPAAQPGYHSVLLTHIDSKVVKFIDSNNTERPWLASREWFDHHWDGAYIIIKPKKMFNVVKAQDQEQEKGDSDSKPFRLRKTEDGSKSDNNKQTKDEREPNTDLSGIELDNPPLVIPASMPVAKPKNREAVEEKKPVKIVRPVRITVAQIDSAFKPMNKSPNPSTVKNQQDTPPMSADNLMKLLMKNGMTKEQAEQTIKNMMTSPPPITPEGK